jgi:putative flippase GtrA
VINLLTFTLVKSLMPTAFAGLTGILVASVWNFLANNRVTFKAKANIVI